MPTKSIRRRSTPTPEAIVSSGVREYLTTVGAGLGIWWRRWQVIRGHIVGGGYVRVGEPGDADILATVPIKGQDGCYILHIETKQKKGRQEEDQKRFQKLIETVPGHHYIVARSSADVEDWLKKMRVLK